MTPRRILMLAFEDAQILDICGPLEVFSRAARLATDEGRRAAPPYVVELVAARRGRLRMSCGIELVAQRPFSDVRSGVDTLFVSGGRGARDPLGDRRLVPWVRKMAGRVRRIASVCTGAYVLAEAGLLDGKRATTHWHDCQRLAAAYPRIEVDPDPIFIRDDRIWTSAGVTAGIDLCLALVEEDLGREVASTVARWLVVFVRRAGGQSQFSAQLAVQAAARAPIRDLQAFIVEHPDAELALPALARRTAMSLRHFSRVFRAEVGVSPAAYVERVRLETARRLLETTSLPIERVAESAGFGTPESLRRTLGRRVGLSPREYRARFGAAANERTAS